MATTTKRAWKLQEFIAHSSQVNCLGLGHRSGRVLVTGGDDKKVNLWAVGKPNCIMSLTGHTTPVESVRFGHTEELVCAGSQAGTLKIWDLEAARLVRTHTGHKAGVKCIEFHPYGEYLASGSTDTCIKLWDTRRKGCIFSYKGHAQQVNAIKFSPDGQWIASGGEEGSVKLWDLRAGKLLTEFPSANSGPVHDVEFHPHEFLLAGGNHDRTVSFWDLEKFQLIGNSERETGPVRRIYFHPEGECLFSGAQDCLRVHGWEPSRTYDMLPLAWGRLADIATASQQLIGAAHHQAHVSLYVVDLKRVQPFCGVNIPEKEGVLSGGVVGGTVGGIGGGVSGTPSDMNVTFRPGQSVRRSFVREKPDTANGKRPTAQVKISEETSDKSGTEGEDSDATASHADIPDINHYENIFRPRNRELNRTPPADEPFEAPPQGSDIDMPMPVRAVDPMNFHAANHRNSSSLLSNKKVSPSPTRRASQPAMPSSYSSSPTAAGHAGSRRGSTTGLGGDVMKPQEVHLRSHTPSSAGHHAPRPYSVYDQRGGGGEASGDYRGGGGRAASQSVPRELPPSPVRASLRTAVNLNACKDSGPEQEYLPPGVTVGGQLPLAAYPPAVPSPYAPSSPSRTPGGAGPPSSPSKSYPTSPLNSYGGGGGGGPAAPFDRPAAVRPSRTSDSGYRSGSGYGHHQPPQPPPAIEQEEKIEMIPSMSDRPNGLNTSDFLPQKFGGLKIGLDSDNHHRGGGNGNRGGGGGGGGAGGGGGYDWPQSQLSESEVTSSILKDHTNIMAVLTQRSRNIEIVRKLWHSKDAKTAVEQAVEFNDPAVVVDLLSVIVLRPSIWNLDLCLHLLPPIGELLLSKYESYVTGAAGALKLVLKNFGSVIKSNIDTPSTTVGVDISKEERLNKCLDCYRELVKIRSTILKRQTLQGKCGHAFRELAILMQCLD